MGNVDIQNDLILPEKNDNIKKKTKKKTTKCFPVGSKSGKKSIIALCVQ